MINTELSTNRRFGIEIEFCSVTGNTLKRALEQAGINCSVEDYNHRNSETNWKVVSDGSVQDSHGHAGLELVSPILSGQAGLEQVKTVAKVMTAIGATINSTCGFHVHVDARDLCGADFFSCVKRYQESESIIDGFMPKSRRANNNQFCRSTSRLIERYTRVWDRDDKIFPLSKEAVVDQNSDRYYKLNLCAFTRHGTIEFRQHSGTIDWQKQLAWIKFCLNFVEKSKVVKEEVLRVNLFEREFTISKRISVATAKRFRDIITILLGSSFYAPIGPATIGMKIPGEILNKSNVIALISTMRSTFSVEVAQKRGAGYYIPTEDKQLFQAIWQYCDQIVSNNRPYLGPGFKWPTTSGCFDGLDSDTTQFFLNRTEHFVRMEQEATARREQRREQRLAQERARIEEARLLRERRASDLAAFRFVNS